MYASQNRVNRWSATVAIAGFLFGFDTAVISGADQPLQALWSTSDLVHGSLVMSAALWGTVIGALAGNWPCERFGRVRTLVGIGVFYFGSALGSALATDPYLFAAWRFVGGLGIGVSSIVAPAYISEISPPGRRGRLVALYQFQIVFGILVAFASNFALATWANLGWRWMLAVECVPAFVYLLLALKLPESPRWLLLCRNDEAAALRVLEAADARTAGDTLRAIRETATPLQNPSLLSRRFMWPVFLAIAIAVFNQLSGINFIIYFAPRVFELAGLDESSALLSTAGVGMVNLSFTLVGMWLIDRAGRRALMFAGSLGYIVSLSVVSWAFATGAGGTVVVGFVFLFIASHAIGQGAVIWVFIAEVFPNSVRTRGQSLGCGTHWVLAAMITLLMPWLLGRFDASTIFAFFAAMMVLQLLFVIFLMPETRGQSLENLAKKLSAY